MTLERLRDKHWELQMRNKFPGICYRCGFNVAAGEGHFERAKNGWRVQHAECAITHRGTDVGKEGATEAREKQRVNELRKRASGTGKRAQRARKALKDCAFGDAIEAVGGPNLCSKE